MLDNRSAGLDQKGFTLVEVMLAVALMGLLAVTFLALVTNYYALITRNNEQVEMTVASQNVLRSTVENLRYGDGVRQTNAISDPNAPAGGWNTNNSAFVIIIPVPALNASRNYIIDPSTGNPYMNELVYYKYGSTLMERKLANPSASGNMFATTCPPALATTNCPSDPVLADYVNSMLFTLYDQNASQTTQTTAARSVNISLSMHRNAPGKAVDITNSIRVTLRNRF